MSETSYIERPNRPLHIYALAYLAFLYIPVLFLPLFSINDSIYVAFPLKEFTNKLYVQLYNNEPMLAALWNSVKVGITASSFFGFSALSGDANTSRQPGSKISFPVALKPTPSTSA